MELVFAFVVGVYLLYWLSEDELGARKQYSSKKRRWVK